MIAFTMDVFTMDVMKKEPGQPITFDLETESTEEQTTEHAEIAEYSGASVILPDPAKINDSLRRSPRTRRASTEQTTEHIEIAEYSEASIILPCPAQINDSIRRMSTLLQIYSGRFLISLVQDHSSYH
ncbi:hypothetical protein Nepgr_001577 [Nepenthes gracilis]|uniref:Uncharacterized protein n=1 Tax=Nepenthes gracilis TaxID=150966 RepID=A0AAD3P7E1_NEPGR|nr:hypothetical protein Nepgr_001577 [Nepenthes gracilis]